MPALLWRGRKSHEVARTAPRRRSRLALELLEDRTALGGLQPGPGGTSLVLNETHFSGTPQDLAQTREPSAPPAGETGNQDSVIEDTRVEENGGTGLRLVAAALVPEPVRQVSRPVVPPVAVPLVALPTMGIPQPVRRITVFPPSSSGTQAVGEITGRLLQEDRGGSTLGDQGVSRQVVYLDLNRNGMWDTEEPATVTDRNGVFHFSGLPQGTYLVCRIVRGFVSQSQPGRTAAGLAVTLAPGQWVADGQHLRVPPPVTEHPPAAAPEFVPPGPEDPLAPEELEPKLELPPPGLDCSFSRWRRELGPPFLGSATRPLLPGEPSTALAVSLLVLRMVPHSVGSLRRKRYSGLVHDYGGSESWPAW
jgi:hypothetical protein